MKTNILVEGSERGTEIDSEVRAFFSRQWEFEQITQGASLINKRTADQSLSRINYIVGYYLGEPERDPMAFANNLDLITLRQFAIKYLGLEKLIRNPEQKHPLGTLLLHHQAIRQTTSLAQREQVESQLVKEIVTNYLTLRQSEVGLVQASEFEAAYDYVVGLHTVRLKALTAHYLLLEDLAWHKGESGAVADLVHDFVGGSISAEVQHQHAAAKAEWDQEEQATVTVAPDARSVSAP